MPEKDHGCWWWCSLCSTQIEFASSRLFSACPSKGVRGSKCEDVVASTNEREYGRNNEGREEASSARAQRCPLHSSVPVPNPLLKPLPVCVARSVSLECISTPAVSACFTRSSRPLNALERTPCLYLYNDWVKSPPNSTPD